jgi:hypothetical protein
MDLRAGGTKQGIFLVQSKFFFSGPKLLLLQYDDAESKRERAENSLERYMHCIIMRVGHPIKQYVQETQV